VKPRFTDLDKYPNGYTPANKTDLAKTFKRIKEQQERIKKEKEVKVTKLNWRAHA
jgi:hypothetical protein